MTWLGEDPRAHAKFNVVAQHCNRAGDVRTHSGVSFEIVGEDGRLSHAAVRKFDSVGNELVFPESPENALDPRLGSRE